MCQSSIVGSVVECSPATRAARVRFPDDAHFFLTRLNKQLLVTPIFYAWNYWYCPCSTECSFWRSLRCLSPVNPLFFLVFYYKGALFRPWNLWPKRKKKLQICQRQKIREKKSHRITINKKKDHQTKKALSSVKIYSYPICTTVLCEYCVPKYTERKIYLHKHSPPFIALLFYSCEVIISHSHLIPPLPLSHT